MRTLGFLAITLALCHALAADAAAPETTLDLSGAWGFRMDANNVGAGQQWFNQPLTDPVTLPGSMDENHRGAPVTAVEVAWLNRLYEYVGPAWYQREVTIPKAWAGKHITLFLERCHWESQAWVDGQAMGMQDSLCTPHVYDLSAALTPGKHRITLRIDNTVKIDVGKHAHSVADHTQTNWNGVIGRMELRAEDPVYIADLQVYSDAPSKALVAKIAVVNDTAQDAHGKIALSVLLGKAADGSEAALAVPKHGRTNVEIPLALGDGAARWDEASPVTYTLSAKLDAGAFHSKREAVFGLRTLSQKDGRLFLNDHPYMLRGNLECCIFPETGYPPTTVGPWTKRFQILKDYGLNHVRFHSWCPPEAAFEAADALGVTLHIETPVWSKVGSEPPVDEFIHLEADRILAAYGNHPSFGMLCVGNEPAGPNQQVFLQDIVSAWKAKDPRRLYTGCAGWPEVPANDYHVRHEREKMPLRLHGGPLGPTTDFDYGKALQGASAPVVAHELGQWCVYPDYAEIGKYTGVLRANNLATFRDSLAAHGMLSQNADFTRASSALQLLLYKADIEAVLRTPGMGGYQLLSLQDFPGQGSALVGFLDAFWDSKCVKPETFREFSGPTVPLARIPKMVYTTAEKFHASIEVAHFGPAPLENAVARWRITDAKDREAAAGAFPAKTIPLGNGTTLGTVDWSLDGVIAHVRMTMKTFIDGDVVGVANMTFVEGQKPGKFTLTVSIDGTTFQNHWNFWVYPAELAERTPRGILIADSLDRKALKSLEKGGKVLLLPKSFDKKHAVDTSFEAIFWNKQWFPTQPSRQLGLFCNPAHPAFAKFATEEHSDWQWWELLNGGHALILDTLPPTLQPTLQLIDDWNTNRKLGAIVEGRVGNGKLLICTLDLAKDLEKRVVARQLRYSLLAYMDSAAFAPKTALKPDALKALFGTPRLKLVRTDSAADGYGGENALDGDPKTCWHTPWEGQIPGFPHEIVFELDQKTTLSGLTYLPRQDVHNGWIGDYAVYVSKNGKRWGDPVATGHFPKNAQEKAIRFDKAKAGKFVRLVAKSGQNADPFVSIAELGIIEPGQDRKKEK